MTTEFDGDKEAEPTEVFNQTGPPECQPIFGGGVVFSFSFPNQSS